MKLFPSLAVLAIGSMLVSGCATGGSVQVARNGAVRGVTSTTSASATSGAARGGSDDRLGGLGASGASRDDFRVNEASAMSAHETRFAGPTPQVPIPRDGRPGSPTNW